MSLPFTIVQDWGRHIGILALSLGGGGETIINPQQSPPEDINVASAKT